MKGMESFSKANQLKRLIKLKRLKRLWTEKIHLS